MVRKLCNIEQIVGDAAHDLAHLGVGKITVRKLLQVIERVAPHIRFNARAHYMPGVGHKVVGRAVDEPQYKVQRAHAQDVAGGETGKIARAPVGDGAHDHWQHQLAHRGERGAEQIEAQNALVPGQVRPEPVQKRAGGV